jgi:hypothetical protein
MSGHRLASDLLDALASTQMLVGDPGDGGTITPDGSHMVCELESAAGGETRVVAAASAYPPGTRLTLIMKTDGSDITVTQAGAADDFGNASNDSTDTLTFGDVGDTVLLIRSYEYQSAQIPAWRNLAAEGVSES